MGDTKGTLAFSEYVDRDKHHSYKLNAQISPPPGSYRPKYSFQYKIVNNIFQEISNFKDIRKRNKGY